MPVVKLPDGTLVTLPDSPAPELSLLDKGKLIADVAMDRLVRPLARGGLDLIQGVDSTLRNSSSPLGRVYDAATMMARVPAPNAEAVLPTPTDETKAETYSRRMLEGAPQAIVGGPSTIIPSMLGPAAGQAARDYVGGISPKLAPVADALANILTQGTLGLASGMHKGWPNSSAKAAEADSGKLADIALERIRPAPEGGFNPAEVANKGAAAANNVVDAVRDAASTSFGDRLAGVTVKAKDVAEIYNGLKATARALPSKEAAAAYDDVADSLVRKDGGGFITDLQTLSGQLKRFKGALASPNAASGVKWAKGDITAAVGDAEMMLGSVAPQFRRANEAMTGYYSDVIDPLLESTVGKISDRNPNIVAPTPLDRLDNIVKGRSPGDIERTIAQLQAGGALPADIARAIVQRKLEQGQLAPGKLVFGGANSPQEKALTALLDASGGAGTAERVRAPLTAADAIAQALKGNNSAITEQASAHSGGLSGRLQLRPGLIEKVKSLFTGGAGSQEITKLLETASPAEAAQLRQLANYDPQLRIALTLAGMGRAALPNSNVIREGM